jgi:O-acetyl-ADP-ribose deacetylase (regulator of RNase III)
MKTAKNINEHSQTTLNVGDAVYTTTLGQLKKDDVKFIIHTLGPIPGSQSIKLVKLSIFNTLKLADHLGVKSLVLPAISGGIFAASGPQRWAKNVRQLIIEAINDYINSQPTKIKTIYLISINEKDQRLWS